MSFKLKNFRGTFSTGCRVFISLLFGFLENSVFFLDVKRSDLIGRWVDPALKTFVQQMFNISRCSSWFRWACVRFCSERSGPLLPVLEDKPSLNSSNNSACWRIKLLGSADSLMFADFTLGANPAGGLLGGLTAPPSTSFYIWLFPASVCLKISDQKICRKRNPEGADSKDKLRPLIPAVNRMVSVWPLTPPLTSGTHKTITDEVLMFHHQPLVTVTVGVGVSSSHGPDKSCFCFKNHF